jgi:iron complex transport system substrate-binding protein
MLKIIPHIKFFTITFYVLILLSSCNSNSTQEKESNITTKKNTQNFIPIKYAKGFEIEEKEGFKVITLKDAWKGERTSYQYVLYKEHRPKGFENAVFIKVPIKKIACMSLTHIALLEKLNQLNSVVAISGRNFTSNATVIERVAADKIKEAGNYQKLNFEILIDESPDVVMAYGVDQSSNANIEKLKELGLSVVLNAEYMEYHPLGKAEWIKFMAAFYDLDDEANKIFSEIEKKYLALLEITKNIKNKPTVFVGMPWNGAWHLAGGESFQATLLKDAGASYLWNENKEKGSFLKDKEVIIETALAADFWLNQNSYSSINQIVGFDSRFKNFKAVKEKRLFNNNKRLNNAQGNDYWESGVINPHIILKDLIEIFHPELQEHELYYYQKLE